MNAEITPGEPGTTKRRSSGRGMPSVPAPAVGLLGGPLHRMGCPTSTRTTIVSGSGDHLRQHGPRDYVHPLVER